MVENHLVEALRAYLAKALEDFRLPAKSGEHRPPQIVEGFLPPKRSSTIDDFPFVIVRPKNGIIQAGETEISVSLIVGCYTEEMDGYRHCMNVASRIRNALTMLPNQTLDRRFQLAFPLRWTCHDDQPFPQWQIDMETQWVTRTPEIRSEREDEIYGYFKKEE